jgi:hypothetical protein
MAEFVNDGDKFKLCEHPFMIFCTSCKLAEFIASILKVETKTIKTNPKAIECKWDSLKHLSKCCQDFENSPNEAAANADVIICTSVIGAGFLIDDWFEAFHVIFVGGTLPFTEEQQFIQRLRFTIKHILEKAII